MQFLESEVSLHDAGGLDPSSQHILLGGDVICFSYPLQVIQVTETETKAETETETETKAETETMRKNMISVIFNLQEGENKEANTAHEHTGHWCTCGTLIQMCMCKYAFYWTALNCNEPWLIICCLKQETVKLHMKHFIRLL